ncbi:YcjF family protein [Exiguobacterium alkaliphilum]|uniref:50S ribosome-binding GTPase n=1 Tax=Exiguobacterium alkaliphilum TaxID=1428684 RepID=A0ABT2L117_9BACL|nr:GTPase [Exiguobacterium alkaliphilum]MCT4795510.1 50S ribosome-binding GTPase [Exiguobacterium alkaliphilum]
MEKKAPFNLDTYDLKEELDRLRGKVKKPNILIAGATGSGKSSVVNHVFGRDLTKVAAGEPVTRGIHEFKSEDVAIVLYDSEGYEIGSARQEAYADEVIGFVERAGSKGAAEQMHLVWYAINASMKRVTALDKALIRRLNDVTSVAVVFTQIDQVDLDELAALREEVKDVVANDAVFQVSVASELLSDPELRVHLDWERLVTWSVEQLDQSLQEGLLMEVRAESEEMLKLKRKKANRIISGYVASAGTAAAVPLPFADAIALTPIQVTMSVHLFRYWGVKTNDDMLRALIGSTVIPQIGRALSKTILLNVMKFFPGANAAASVINATVASGITWAIGLAINEVAYRNAMDSSKTIEQLLNSDFGSLFEQFMAQNPVTKKKD